MTKKELLGNPVFQKARPEALLFFVRNYGRDEQETHGVGELYYIQVKGEICFCWGAFVCAITKQELLDNRIFRKGKNDYELSFCSTGAIHTSYQVEVRMDKDGDVYLLDSFIDQDGTRVYL